MRRLARAPALANEFLGDLHAAAAVEFAIILPFLILLGSGVYEFTRAIAAARHLTNTANSIAQILSTNTTGTVSYSDLQYAHDSAMLSFPEVLADSTIKGVAWGNDITISMAGVSFTPTVTGCTSSCTYKANIVWTGGAEGRACGTNPTSASNTAQPSATTLPSGLFTPGVNPQGGNTSPNFIIVTDLSYSWSPLIFTKFINSFVMKRSAYINPRYTSTIKYSIVTGDNGIGKECPGF